jgi:hypothetical protein
MGRRALRDAFAAGLRAEAPCAFVECRVAAGEARRRAAARLHDPERVSDAGPDVAAALAAAWEPLDEVAPAAHVAVRGDLPPGAALDAVDAILDARP